MANRKDGYTQAGVDITNETNEMLTVICQKWGISKSSVQRLLINEFIRANATYKGVAPDRLIIPRYNGE